MRYVILLSIILVSCKKEEDVIAPRDAASAVKTTASIIGPVQSPAIIWWSNLGTIPYTDDIPGDVPRSNQYPIGWSINGKGYVCGSLLTTGVSTGDYIRDLWEYDTATRAWTKRTPYPGDGLIESTCFVIAGKAYVIAGNTNYAYDPTTDTWTKKAPVPAGPRNYATAFAIKNKGYLGLGYLTETGVVPDQNDWWEYDPAADRWTFKGPFQGSARSGANGFVIGEKGYVLGGNHYANGHGNYLKDVWEYDPVRNSWTRKTDFPGHARMAGIAQYARVNGVDVGFWGGGDGDRSTGFTYNDMWEYNPTTDFWGQLQTGAARSNVASFVIGRSLYIANMTVIAMNWSK